MLNSIWSNDFIILKCKQTVENRMQSHVNYTEKYTRNQIVKWNYCKNEVEQQLTFNCADGEMGIYRWIVFRLLHSHTFNRLAHRRHRSRYTIYVLLQFSSHVRAIWIHKSANAIQQRRVIATSISNTVSLDFVWRIRTLTIAHTIITEKHIKAVRRHSSHSVTRNNLTNHENWMYAVKSKFRKERKEKY